MGEGGAREKKRESVSMVQVVAVLEVEVVVLVVGLKAVVVMAVVVMAVMVMAVVAFIVEAVNVVANGDRLTDSKVAGEYSCCFSRASYQWPKRQFRVHTGGKKKHKHKRRHTHTQMASQETETGRHKSGLTSRRRE